jgi:hypothetical protein
MDFIQNDEGGKMLDEQRWLLMEYVKLNNRPSYKKISEDTGIQTTRVFRLFNGSKMKLCEYKIFKEKVDGFNTNGSSLEKLARECAIKLSSHAKEELTKTLMRKLEMWRLTQTKFPSNSTSNKLLA